MDRVSDLRPTLAVIPARGGSKGLPGKNIRLLAGVPLIGHSIRMARMSTSIDRVIVSTDSDDIAATARREGGEVPFMRPADLALDTTPMWPVIRHALEHVESSEGRRYGSVILLDPTSPGRLPADVQACLAALENDPAADGICAVSQPEFNPYWHCVINDKGRMTDLIAGAQKYARRQEVPPVYRINGMLYVWRAGFVRREPMNWRSGRILMHEVPEHRAIHIDDIHEFEKADLMIRHGLVELPWLERG